MAKTCSDTIDAVTPIRIDLQLYIPLLHGLSPSVMSLKTSYMYKTCLAWTVLCNWALVVYDTMISLCKLKTNRIEQNRYVLIQVVQY